MFHDIKVKNKEHLIPDATTLTFETTKTIEEEYTYLAGQYIVLKFIINGKEVRRSYSFNSSPVIEEPLQITIKRVPDGLVSNHIGDNVQIGDTIKAMKPQGGFCVRPQAEDYKTYYLFAAGSGITPIFSMVKTILSTSPKSVVNLFYGNKDQESILFKDHIDHLVKQYDGHLNVVHTLTRPKTSSNQQDWKGRTGRVDASSVEWFISNYAPIAQSTEYYICGPDQMNTSVAETLTELGVPKQLIHIEQFGTKEGAESITESSDETENDGFAGATLKVEIHGESHELILDGQKTILDALKEAGLDPPYSCETGICGSCVADVISGDVSMKDCLALNESEIENGEILCCRAHVTSENAEIEFL